MNYIREHQLLVVAVAAVIVLLVAARISFQQHRKRKRVCRCCGGRDILRYHEPLFASSCGDKLYIIDTTTFHECRDKCCTDYGKPDPVKGRYITVRKAWWSPRHWRYGYLLRKHLDDERKGSTVQFAQFSFKFFFRTARLIRVRAAFFFLSFSPILSIISIYEE